MDLKNFSQAMRELAEEKGVSTEKIIGTIELAVAAAYKKDYGKRGQIIRAKLDPQTGELKFWQVKVIVDDSMVKSEEEIVREEAAREEVRERAVKGDESKEPEPSDDDDERAASAGEKTLRKVRFNPERHIRIEEAAATKPDVKPGDELEFPLEAKYDFGRIASQTAKQVINQRIREAEREATFNEYKGREGEVVSGLVQRIEGRNVFLDLERGIGLMPPEEQIPREHYRLGERLKALLFLVEKESRGPGLFLSRTHPKFLEKLFEIEVPEISSGTVEIRAVAREPGSRSKVAAASTDPAVDPVGSLVGQRGVRVSTVINEIGGEKIDIIEWAEDPAEFISNALSPAKVLQVGVDPERREARAIVPDDQLSLAIGRGGQNVRLAAKLTGWRIDVRSAGAPETPASGEASEDEKSPSGVEGQTAGTSPVEAEVSRVEPVEALEEEKAAPPDEVSGSEK